MQINGQEVKYNNSAYKHANLSLKFLLPNYQHKEQLLCVGDKVSTLTTQTNNVFRRNEQETIFFYG